MMMIDLKLISVEKQFIDGTKIGANAHKYSFVWKKAIEKNKERLQGKTDAVLQILVRLSIQTLCILITKLTLRYTARN